MKVFYMKIIMRQDSGILILKIPESAALQALPFLIEIKYFY